MNPCKGYMHEGTHDFQTNGKNNLDDSVKAKWRVKLSPTQTLHRHNANTASSQRKHCTVTTQTLHHHDANATPSRHKHCTITTQTLRRYNTSAAPLLGKAFHCTDTTHALFRWNADEKKNEMF